MWNWSQIRNEKNSAFCCTIPNYLWGVFYPVHIVRFAGHIKLRFWFYSRIRCAASYKRIYKFLGIAYYFNRSLFRYLVSIFSNTVFLNSPYSFLYEEHRGNRSANKVTENFQKSVSLTRFVLWGTAHVRGREYTETVMRAFWASTAGG